MAPQAYTLTARWIFPVAGLPLERGTITIFGSRIQSVESNGVRAPDIDLGNAAILPGFVNAHTHLDLSDAFGKCPPTPDFTAWLRAVIAHRRGQTPEDVDSAIDIGLSQCLRFGTTLVGDISAGGTSWKKLARAPMAAVVFLELLGLDARSAKRSWGQVGKWLDRRVQWPRAPGLSPHAPFSVSYPLFKKLAGVERSRRRLKIAIHVAESAAELRLLEERKGPFVAFLKELGVWRPDALAPNVQSILNLFTSSSRALVIHGNYLDPSIKIPGCLVYCPRTHAAFGHPPHPFRQFLANGTPVALGTDSLASNPDLDMLAEIRFLQNKHPDIAGAQLLSMATSAGARALGFDHITGSLTRRKSADLVVLPLPDAEAFDPHSLILRSSLAVKAVVFRGKQVYSTDQRLDLPRT